MFEQPKIILDGDVSPLRQKLREASRDLKKFGDDGTRSVDGLGAAFGGLQSKAAGALTGILSLGALAVFAKSTKDAAVQAEASFRGLESVANYTGVGIGKAMQEAGQLAADGLMTTAEASKALQNLLSRGYSIDQAVQTLTRLKDSAAFNRAAHLSMGEAVVTASEGLKNENSILVDNAGVTKNVSKMWEEYAATIGKGANSLTQAEKIQAEFNGILRETEAQSGNAAKAMSGMQGQQAKLNAETQNLKIAIGQGLTPAFTALARTGSYLVENFFKPMLWAVQAIGIGFAKAGGEISAFMGLLKTGNLTAYRAELKRLADLSEQMRSEAAAKINAPMGAFTPSGDSGKRRSPDPQNTGGGGGAKSGSAKTKTAGASEDVFDNGSFIANKAAADFIRKQYEDANALQKDLVDDANKTAREVAEAYKKSAQQQIQIDLLRVQSARDAEMARLDELEAQSAQAAALGAASQQEHLARLAAFNQQRLAADLAYIAQKKDLAQQDPEQNPVELERIELEKAEIRRRYAAQGMDIQRQQAIESQGIWRSLTDSINGLWDQGVQALMNGTLTWRNAFRAIGAELVSWFATSVVGVKVKAWLAGETAQTVATKLGAGARALWEKITSIKILSSKSAETTAVTGMDAVQAATGAAKSQAGIPIVGPVLALAAMAAVFAAVSSMGKKKSAMGGYDIPKGLNPMTQLHEEEMVLPKNLANAVRGMASGGAGGSNPVNVTMNIQTPDADSFRASQDQISADLHARIAALSRGI